MYNMSKHYSDVKNEKSRLLANVNARKYGTFKFVGGGFLGEVEIIDTVRTSDKEIMVLYLSKEELAPNSDFKECVIGHHVKLDDNVIISLDDKAKLHENASNYIRALSDLTDIKLDIEKSLGNVWYTNTLIEKPEQVDWWDLQIGQLKDLGDKIQQRIKQLESKT